MTQHDAGAAAGDVLAAALAFGRVADGPYVCCPVCGHECAHLGGVEFRASRGEPVTVRFDHREDDPHVAVRVERGAVLSQLGPIRASSRRGSLMVVFEGECGHLFGLTFEQHKGTEFIHVVALGERVFSE